MEIFYSKFLIIWISCERRNVRVLLANKSVMSGNFADVKVPFDHDY